MPDERSLFGRMMNFFDFRFGEMIADRPPRKIHDGRDQSGSGTVIVADSSSSSGSFDDCGSAGDAGGGVIVVVLAATAAEVVEIN